MLSVGRDAGRGGRRAVHALPQQRTEAGRNGRQASRCARGGTPHGDVSIARAARAARGHVQLEGVAQLTQGRHTLNAVGARRPRAALWRGAGTRGGQGTGRAGPPRGKVGP